MEKMINFSVGIPSDALSDLHEILNDGEELNREMAIGVVQQLLSNVFTEYLGEPITIRVTPGR